MRERICKWQDTILDTATNTHVSRCVCLACEYGFDVIIKARCMKCKHRPPIIGDNQVALSIMADIDVEVDERSDEEINSIIETHCKKCDQYTEDTDVCKMATCSCHSAVKEAARNLHTHCPDKVW